MRDLIKLLIDIYTAPDLDWRIPVWTGVGVVVVLAVLLPLLMPWTGLLPVLLEALFVVGGLLGGGALMAYGGWLWYQEREEAEWEDEDDDEDEDDAVGDESAPSGGTKADQPPVCPKCGGAMQRKSLSGRRFWMCRTYPRCRGMQPID